MLPDLPGLKRDIQKAFDRYLWIQVNVRFGVFSKVPRHAINEGNRTCVVRPDGSRDESELKKASTEISVKLDDVPQLTLEKRLAMLNEMADQTARQMSEHFFGMLNEVLDKAGQVVDQKGQPFDAEAVFAVLEKMQFEFDESGQHNEISIVVPPALAPKAKEVFERIQSDPVLRKRHDEIMVRKRMDWRDREASRKLVG